MFDKSQIDFLKTYLKENGVSNVDRIAMENKISEMERFCDFNLDKKQVDFLEEYIKQDELSKIEKIAIKRMILGL